MCQPKHVKKQMRYKYKTNEWTHFTSLGYLQHTNLNNYSCYGNKELGKNVHDIQKYGRIEGNLVFELNVKFVSQLYTSQFDHVVMTNKNWKIENSIHQLVKWKPWWKILGEKYDDTNLLNLNMKTVRSCLFFGTQKNEIQNSRSF